MHNALRTAHNMLNWRPWAPKLIDIPFEGQRLDDRPEAFLANAGAGLITNGTHLWAWAFKGATSGYTTLSDPSETVTTDTSTNGKACILCPQVNATVGLFRSKAGAPATFYFVADVVCNNSRRTAYLDNLADGSLGSAHGGTNNASPAITHVPSVLADRIAALTADAFTDYLVCYFVLGYQWVMQTGASYNVCLLVPGNWTGATQQWPLDPTYLWVPTDDPTTAVALPAVSQTWAALEAALDAADATPRDMPVTLLYGSGSGGSAYTVTVNPYGMTPITVTAPTKAGLALNVCKALLTAVHDVDYW